MENIKDYFQVFVKELVDELSDDLISITIQSDLTKIKEGRDIDTTIVVDELSIENFEKITRLIHEIHRKYPIRIDPFVYELKELENVDNLHLRPLTVKLVKSCYEVIYGNDAWKDLDFSDNEVKKDSQSFIHEVENKFRSFMQYLGKKDDSDIVDFSLNHTFLIVKAANALKGAYNLGKENNLNQFKSHYPDLFLELESIYNSQNGNGVEYFLKCYKFVRNLMKDLEKNGILTK
jgi:hypothetical protein